MPAICMLGFFKKRRLEKIRRQPSHADRCANWAHGFTICARVNQIDRVELDGQILVCLAEKRFKGCGCQEITDEVPLFVGVQVCLLLYRQTDYYPRINSVLRCLSAAAAKNHPRKQLETTDLRAKARLGESWRHGAVVRAWRAIGDCAEGHAYGQNLAQHKFANQFGHENGLADVVLQLESSGRADWCGRYTVWARVAALEFTQRNPALEQNMETASETDGATEHAEFLSLQPNFFFAKNTPTENRHPHFYEQPQRFYRQNPTGYVPLSGRAGQLDQ